MSNIVCLNNQIDNKSRSNNCTPFGSVCFYNNQYYSNSEITSDQINNSDSTQIKNLNFQLAYLTEDQIKLYKDTKQTLINNNLGK